MDAAPIDVVGQGHRLAVRRRNLAVETARGVEEHLRDCGARHASRILRQLKRQSPRATGVDPASLPPESRRLVVIGAGHVFRIRQAIQEAVVALAPTAVCLELDADRYAVLATRARGQETEMVGGFVAKRLAKFQEEVARMYGAEVGEEMLAAAQGARAAGARLAFVDDSAAWMQQQVKKALGWRERLRLAGMILGGAAKAVLPSARRGAKEKIEGELAKYQTNPEAVLAELEEKFPTLHRVLVTERNERMARRIRDVCGKHARVVVVVGDAHVPGLARLLEDLQPDLFRLADVREGRLPRGPMATGQPSKVTYSWTWTAPGPPIA